MDLAIEVDQRVKIKESKKSGKDLDLAREQQKMGNIRVIMLPIVIGTLGMVTKSLERDLEESEIRGKSRLFR